MKRKLAASIALVVEATNEVVQKRTTLIGAAFLPMVGIFLIDAISAEMSLSGFSQFSIALTTLPFYTLFATVVHRVVLLGEESLPNRWGIFWTEREFRFLGWLIGIWLLYFALSLPMGLIAIASFEVFGFWNLTWVATFVSYLVVAYFEGRISLVLPATATDRRSSFRESWAMSRGKGIVIAVALVLPAMILIPIEWALYAVVDDAYRRITDLVWTLLVLPILAVDVAIISLAFDKLSFRDGE